MTFVGLDKLIVSSYVTVFKQWKIWIKQPCFVLLLCLFWSTGLYAGLVLNHLPIINLSWAVAATVIY